jgi:hypothetical protein
MERRFGCLEPALPEQGVGAVDVRFDKRRGQCDCPLGARQAGAEFSLLDQHRGEVRVRDSIIGFEGDRAPIGLGRLGPLAHGLQSAAKIGVGSRKIGDDRECAADQLNGARIPAPFVRDDPEQVQRVGVVGSFLQHFPVKRLGAIASTRLVMGIGRRKIAGHLGCPQAVLPVA